MGDVIAVAAGESDLQRDVVGVDDQVVLGAGPAAIDFGWVRCGPPLRARTWSRPPSTGPDPMRRWQVTPETPSRLRGSW